MSLFCHHNYKPKNVLCGENLLGNFTYGIAFYCVKCNRRKIDKGWASEVSAEKHLRWLKEQNQ